MKILYSKLSFQRIGTLFALLLLFLISYHKQYFYRKKAVREDLLEEEPLHENDSIQRDVFGSGNFLRTYFHSHLQNHGVVLATKGGIGNQLFEYACSYALAKRKNWPLYINYDAPVGSGDLRQFKPQMREFALDKFKIPLNNIIKSRSTNFPEGDPLSLSDDALFHDSYNHSRKFLRQTGYCQSELYWKEFESEIKEMFQPRLESMNLPKIQGFIDLIQSSESVAIHVRRGDFLTSRGFDVPISFQRRAIHLMVEILNKTQDVTNPTFFVFSDDIRHTKKKLSDFARQYSFVYVSEANNTSIEDLYLMSLCKHNIIPNSTFSWWAAYLNKNKRKVVIASAFNPKFWNLWKGNSRDLQFNMNLYGTIYHMKEWIVIDPFTGGLPFNDELIKSS